MPVFTRIGTPYLDSSASSTEKFGGVLSNQLEQRVQYLDPAVLGLLGLYLMVFVHLGPCVALCAIWAFVHLHVDS